MDEEPFAVGFDFLDGAAGDGRVEFDAFEFWEDGFKGGDGLVGERAVERACGAENCVAFRHGRVDRRKLEVASGERLSSAAEAAGRSGLNIEAEALTP